MSTEQRQHCINAVSVLRAQVDIIEGKELPMALSKVAVCKEAGWTWLESYFTGYANDLQRQLTIMQQMIDNHIDALAAR